MTLRRIYGDRDPRGLARDRAWTLFLTRKVKGPPFDPEAYVDGLVTRCDLPVAGLVQHHPILGHEIKIRAGDVPHRQRFTIAHEVGHLMFDAMIGRSGRDRHHQDHEEELLCNVVAAELLMPRPVFSQSIRDLGADPAGIAALSARFDVSLQACALQVAQHSQGRLAFAFWEASDQGPWLRWTTTKRMRKAVLKLTGQSTVERALKDVTSASGRDTYIVGGLAHSRWVMSECVAPHKVLSVLFPGEKSAAKWLATVPPPHTTAKQVFLPAGAEEPGATEQQLPFPFLDSRQTPCDSPRARQ